MIKSGVVVSCFLFEMKNLT